MSVRRFVDYRRHSLVTKAVEVCAFFFSVADVTTSSEPPPHTYLLLSFPTVQPAPPRHTLLSFPIFRHELPPPPQLVLEV